MTGMRLSVLTLDRVVEGEDVDPLSVLDVLASVHVAEITKLDSKVVSSDCIRQT